MLLHGSCIYSVCFLVSDKVQLSSTISSIVTIVHQQGWYDINELLVVTCVW